MAWRGYNESAYGDLDSMIESSKQNVLAKIDEFRNFEGSIKEIWVGPDADSYVSQLLSAITSAYNSVDSVFSAMKRDLAQTYNDWVAKQQSGS